ncbi:DUF5325 family protein [Salisediminibacterium halotolerans]|uniref:PEP-CTERM protein-sorting domain-containing protein n=1 Tax=Salisediminibacterium halotolerans TaxID=517425 RepID=A0A1H9PR01_9BACI|nr:MULTISPECIES: DUF5325 family protein [Salisediminibacterium]RLJ74344.1 putative secreted protein with PEP-CTERM sorting signal [Actinophytocola xinjiangensis]RPE87563.1 putative secreted protein with PEP-CTERM sorting signal [Salisediminibacterium halotolerans]TWG35181.1 putative secreted protein with PEP-CTERM sorting signal [Salisediminibacterium halotolerans]SER50624.1 PEP-CTERM protein-sorting domain-containing protein [Salisediminibacterium haloalkalitolerans]GEL08608.1 hypothetical pr
MDRFDLISFIYAILGTAGMVGIGISLAQLSLTIFTVSFLLTLGAFFFGFRRKNKRYPSPSHTS